MSTGYIAAALSLAVFLMFTAVMLLKGRSFTGAKDDPDDAEMSFALWHEKVYDLLTDKDPAQTAKLLGIDVNRINSSCRVLGLMPDFKKMSVLRLAGLFAVIISAGVFAITRDSFISLAGIVSGAMLILMPGYRLNRLAREKKLSIKNELPRFLDLLQTALYVDMPVELAIETTSFYLKDSVLSKAFRETMSDVRIGASNWRESLEMMAQRYEVDDFSDFVMNLAISYEKGMSIYASVSEKSRDMKKSNLLAMKERAAKLNSGMVIPIVIFKLLPLLLIMLVPVIRGLGNALV